MHFAQEAAGVFGELRDVVSLRVEAPRPVDVSPECANMLERLCLAQVRPCCVCSPQCMHSRVAGSCGILGGCNKRKVL